MLYTLDAHNCLNGVYKGNNLRWEKIAVKRHNQHELNVSNAMNLPKFIIWIDLEYFESQQNYILSITLKEQNIFISVSRRISMASV